MIARTSKAIGLLALLLLSLPAIAPQSLGAPMRLARAGLRVRDRLSLGDVEKRGGRYFFIVAWTDEPGIYALEAEGSEARLVVPGRFEGFVRGASALMAVGREAVGSALVATVYRIDERERAAKPVCSGAFLDPPLFMNGRIYYFVEGEGTYRVDPESGATERLARATLALAVASDRELVGWLRDGDGWRLAAIDGGTGALRAFARAEPGPIAAAGGEACYADSRAIYAIDTRSGAIRMLEERRVDGWPVVYGGKAYYSSADEGRALRSVSLASGEGELLASGTPCKPLIADAEGLAYSTRNERSMVWGAMGNETLWVLSLDDARNPRRMFRDAQFSLRDVEGGIALGTFPEGVPGLFAVDLASGGVIHLASEPELYPLAFLSGGRAYWVDSEKTLFAKRLDGSRKAEAVAADVERAVAVGDRVVYADARGRLSTAGKDAKVVATVEAYALRSSDGYAYYVTQESGTSTLWRMDPATGRTERLRAGVETGDFVCLAVRAGIAYYGHKGRLFAYDTRTRSERDLSGELPGFITSIAVSESYAYLALDSGGGDGIFKVPLAGGPIARVCDGELFGLLWDEGRLYWYDYGESYERADSLSYCYALVAE
jgi:hypothetical protein